MKISFLPYTLILFITCLCISFSVTAQRNDSTNFFITKGRALFREHKYKEAHQVFQKANSFENSTTAQKIIINHNLGESQRRIGGPRKAIIYLNKAYELARKNNMIDKMVRTDISLTVCYKYMGEYPTAIEHAYRALNISKKNNNDKLIAKCFNELASVYTKQQEFDEAEKMYLKAKLLFEKAKDDKSLALNLNNIGIIYNYKEEYRTAIKYFYKSLEIKKTRKESTASNYNNIGDSYIGLAMSDSAIYFYKKSIEIKKERNDRRGLAYSYNNISKVYLTLDSLKKAYKAIEKAGEISSKLNNKGQLKSYYLNKKDYFELTNQPDSSLLYFEKYHDLYTGILNIENTRVIADMREKHKSDQLKKENALKDITLRNNQNYISALFMVIVLIGISLFLAVRSYVIKRKAHLLESEALEEIQLAHGQIKTVMNEMSHRIKNNLQLLMSMMSIQSRQLSDHEARKVTLENRNRVSAMAIIHRKLYKQHDATHFNMRYYLENLCDNIGASYSMEDQVKIDYSIDEQLDIDVNQAILLGLIANELVSNSFKYAFAGIKNARLEVTFQQTVSTYILYIADNGIGLTVEEEEKKGSFGLTLVQQLCQQLKGEFRYKHPNQGAGFSIEIPKKK